MTFEEFQKTRKDMNAAQAVARYGEMSGHGEDIATRVLVYLDGLVIGIFQHTLNPDDVRNGQFYLILGRDEWVSPDLESLERKLFDWAISAGYGHTETGN